MSYVDWKVTHNRYIGDKGWDSVTTDITEFFDPQVIVNLGEGKDTFSMKVLNSYGKYNNFFNNNDKITIYRVSNKGTFSESDILMIGTLQVGTYDKSGTQSQVRLEGYNYSEAIMSAIVFADPTGQTIPQALQTALEEVNANNSAFQTTWYAGNPTVKTNGSAFPTVQERWFNKTMKSILEKYSSSINNEDKAYHWYVNNANQLMWLPPSSGSYYTFNSNNDTHKNIKVGVDPKGIKNYFVLKGGTDPAGKPIQTYYQNLSSIVKHGRKYQFVNDYKTYAESLNQADLVKSYGTSASDINTRYPTFPMETSWKSSITTTVQGIAMTKGSYVSIPSSGNSATDQTRYVAIMRAHIKQVLKDMGLMLSLAYQYGKLKVDLEFPAGEKEWRLGDRVLCDIPEKNHFGKELRVNEIQYTSEQDVFSLEEDLPTI